MKTVTLPIEEYEELVGKRASQIAKEVSELLEIKKLINDRTLLIKRDHIYFDTTYEYADGFEDLVRKMDKTQYKHMKKVWRNRNN